MSGSTIGSLKGFRGMLEDILAPTLGRLEVRVAGLAERLDRMAAETKADLAAQEALLRRVNEQLAILNGRLSKLEGRTEGMKSELTVALQLEILKMAQGFQPIPGVGRNALPAPEDSP